LLVDALEHTVLRVLILQTLVNNSVVKDSTHLVPSLVSGINTPPAPFYIHHHLRRTSRVIPVGPTGSYQLGFSCRGAPYVEEEFDLARRRSLGEYQH
jgi:hypothetical protein